MQRNVKVSQTLAKAKERAEAAIDEHVSSGNFCVGLALVLQCAQLVLGLFSGTVGVVMGSNGSLSKVWSYALGGAALAIAILRSIDLVPFRKRADAHQDAINGLSNICNNVVTWENRTKTSSWLCCMAEPYRAH